MMRDRKQQKMIAKDIKRMSDTKVYEFLQNMCQNYADNILEEALKVLHDEFGFGVGRQQKFLNELNRRMHDESENVD